MIKLEDHIKVIDGVEYVPLEIAKASIAVAYNDKQLDQAMNMIKKSMKEINDGLNSLTEDD